MKFKNIAIKIPEINLCKWTYDKRNKVKIGKSFIDIIIKSKVWYFVLKLKSFGVYQADIINNVTYYAISFVYEKYECPQKTKLYISLK